MHKVIRIKNLDCANCAAELSERLAALNGITEAHADFINQRVTIDYEQDGALERAIYLISHFEEVEIVDGNAPVKKERHLKEVISIAVAAALFLPALVLQILKGQGLLEVSEWVYFALYLAAFVAAGWDVFFKVVMNFAHMFKGGFHPSVFVDENLLMTIAAVGAFAIGEYLEGGAVMILYQIGELLQTIAVGSSRNSIAKLASLQENCALRVLEGGETAEVDASELTAGDVILLRKGDRIPADCILEGGETSLDTKSLTGESYLREVKAGDELLAGCLNAGGAVKARVLRPASESAVQKILDMVESSSSKKAKPEKFITKFARIYTPVVVALALLVAVIPPLFTGYDFAKWIARALNFLVISCPCALIISVPLTYFAGVGALARLGVLTKGATYLDLLAKVKVAAFDKTGTLTEGKFSVSDVVGGDHVQNLAAGIEKNSSHPLAEAFADMDGTNPESCMEIAGMGMAATVEGKRVLVGSKRLMESEGIACRDAETEDLAVYVAEEGVLLGYVTIADRLRKEAKEGLESLRKAGIEKCAVLTGDTPARAARALGGLGIDEVRAGLLPEEKPLAAANLKLLGPLLYVGDGINDTPVMAEADVSAAMGGLGSDAAIEASDFVLASDDLRALAPAVKTAKKTRRIVFENIVFSIAVKVALMAVSLFGVLPLWAAVLGDVGVMLLAVLNALRMRLAPRKGER